MGGIENAVKKGSRLTRVRRRVAGTRGADGRLTPADDVVALVKLYVQPTSTQLNRQLPGDSTTGGTQIWASKTFLSAAYVEDDIDQIALNWTGLQIAPTQNTDGPPGDQVEWQGRLYEITGEEIWDDAGLVADSRYRFYSAAERGPA